MIDLIARLRGVAVLTVVSFASLGLSLLDRGGAPPASAAPTFATPEQVASQLVANDSALRQGVDAWRAGEDPPTAPPPVELMAQSRYLQSTVRLLAARPRLATASIGLLPAGLASEVRELTAAARKLRLLSRGSRPRRLKIGAPRPLAELAAHYRAAEEGFGIGARYLAAINLVETKFGRVKSNSVAGARGPMQFIPSTWRIYGHGGNVNDPRDAIPAAARLLRGAGAPRSYDRALYAYNPSRLYVGAVKAYARVIARDPYAVYFLYCWGP